MNATTNNQITVDQTVPEPTAAAPVTTQPAPLTVQKLAAIAPPARFSLTPANMREAMEFAKVIAASDVVPPVYKGKPGNVLVAVQMGAEVGLGPMQALQNIAVINGQPSIWGDAITALVKTHPLYEWTREEWHEDSQTASCTMKRRGEPPRTQTFSKRDAIDAGLMGKDTYKRHLRRMCERRARGRCAQDVFPDALKGLKPAEEALDYIDGTAETWQPEPGQVAAEGERATTTQRLAGKLAERAAAEREAAAAEEVDTETGEIAEAPADEGAPFTVADVLAQIQAAESVDDINEALALVGDLDTDDDTRRDLKREAGKRAKALSK